MKTVKKILKVTGLFLLTLVLISVIYVAKTNNTGHLFVDNYETGGQAGLKKLNEMIKDAWVDRDFFEVIVRSRNHASFCLYYDMANETLVTSTDLHSGWDGYYKLTLVELENLAAQQYSTSELFSEFRERYPHGNSSGRGSRREGIFRFFSVF